jgi:hypothetical protein
MNIKPKLLNILEDSIVMIVMMFVLLPVRIVFVRYVSDEWIGSFGLVTIVIVSLVLLSKYNKLGLFGRMFWRTSIRFKKGKKRFISYFAIGTNIILWSMVISGIQYAEYNPDIIEEKRNLLSQMTPEDQAMIDKINQAAEAGDLVTVNNEMNDQLKNIDISLILLAAISIMLLPFIDFTAWSLVISFTNDFVAGYILHFATVLLVESFEIIGLMIYIHLAVKPKLI